MGAERHCRQAEAVQPGASWSSSSPATSSTCSPLRAPWRSGSANMPRRGAIARRAVAQHADRLLHRARRHPLDGGAARAGHPQPPACAAAAPTRVVPAEELVPGDIVVLEAGDAVPADLRLIEASALAADESTLTGESVPVDKACPAGRAPRRACTTAPRMLYRGTSLTRGSAAAVVVATGAATELGRISSLVATAEPETSPIEKRPVAAVRAARAGHSRCSPPLSRFPASPSATTCS